MGAPRRPARRRPSAPARLVRHQAPLGHSETRARSADEDVPSPSSGASSRHRASGAPRPPRPKRTDPLPVDRHVRPGVARSRRTRGTDPRVPVARHGGRAASHPRVVGRVPRLRSDLDRIRPPRPRRVPTARGPSQRAVARRTGPVRADRNGHRGPDVLRPLPLPRAQQERGTPALPRVWPIVATPSTFPVDGVLRLLLPPVPPRVERRLLVRRPGGRAARAHWRATREWERVSAFDS